MFITLDGIDGVGKTTQWERLVAWLRAQGHSVVAARDPGSTALGERIREVLLHDHGTPIARHSEMLLFMAARAQLVAEIIRPALERGEVVVTDRFLLSTVVYQGHAGGLDVDDIWRVGRIATGGVLPQLTIVLDMPLEGTAARMQRSLDRMERQGEDFRRRLRDGFLAEARRDSSAIQVVDASRGIDEVQHSIGEIVQQWIAAQFSGERR